MRVFEWKTLMRNESKGRSAAEVGTVPPGAGHYRPIKPSG